VFLRQILESDFGFPETSRVARALLERDDQIIARRNCVFATDWSVVGSRCRGGRGRVRQGFELRIPIAKSCAGPRPRWPPVYPDLARKMNITGVVKVQVVVAPNGTVKDAKVVGGHPVLANAALEAVKKWRFEPAAVESTGVVDFKFEPHQ